MAQGGEAELQRQTRGSEISWQGWARGDGQEGARKDTHTAHRREEPLSSAGGDGSSV